MPLLKKTPFALMDPPDDLEPNESVYQIRFTKEIFRDYNDYLNRINFYRQRVWTCRVTGKINLTYEEALVSENDATEKVQQLPKELIVPALRIIQFSTLSLKELANTISAKMQDCLFVGAELCGKIEGGEFPCKILKILEGPDKTCYEVEWLDRKFKTTGNILLSGRDLVRKKPAFSRSILKSFIRESTYRSNPWVLHNKLALEHGISTIPPKDLQEKLVLQNGLIVGIKKKRRREEDEENLNEMKDRNGKCKRKKADKEYNGSTREDDKAKEVIEYPIDDLLVRPGPDDPLFTDRPSPSTEFKVPMDFVGDILLVWDFCSSFSRLLCLSPFSLEDFENAICHKDSNVVLIVECHAALLRVLIKDNREYYLAVQGKKGKIKVTLVTWTEYLCTFLELINVPELCSHISTIKRGHYGLLDAHAKLGIFRELVNQVIGTDIIREKLDKIIEKRHALGANRRAEALEEARKKREEKEHQKAESNRNGHANGHIETVEGESHASGCNSHSSGNGSKKGKSESASTHKNHTLKKSEIEDSDVGNKSSKKQKTDLQEDLKDQKEVSKQLKDDKEISGKSSKEQREEYYEREMEKCFVRTNPLGRDRDYNRYWWFHRDGRIFVESLDSKQWAYYSTKEELDALMGSLNPKGERERALNTQLKKFYSRISLELQKRCKELAHKIEDEEAILRRSTRVRAPSRENPANAFLKYVNKWKED